MLVRVLGPVEAWTEHGPLQVPIGKPLAALAILALAGGRAVPADQMVEGLWGADAPPTALKTLQVHMSTLRARLRDGEVGISLTPAGYRLEVDAEVVDVVRFERLATAGMAAATDGHPEAAAQVLRDALGQWSGDPLSNVLDAPFAERHVQRLRRRRSSVLQARVAADLALGLGATIVDELRQIADEHPYDERACGHLMVALYRAGRPAEALDTFRSFRRQLGDDLGLEPGPALLEVERQVLMHDGRLRSVEAAARGPGASATNATPADPADPAGAHARPGDLDAQIEASIRSSELLRRVGALDDALRVIDRSILVARADAPHRLAVLLVHRSMLLALSERAEDGEADLAAATQLARRFLDGPALAQVALARFGLDAGSDDDDGLLVQLLEPIDLLEPRAPQRVDLLCAAMQQIVYSADSATAEKLLALAESTAAGMGDARSQAVAAATRTSLAGVRFQQLDAQLGQASASLAEARAIGDPLLLIAAWFADVRARFDAGDVDTCAANLTEFRAAAHATMLPFAWVRPDLIDAAVRLARGQTDGLEDRILRIRERGARMHARSVRGSANSLLFGTWLELDRFDVLDAMLVDRDGSSELVWQALGSMIAATLGRPDAREQLDRVLASMASADPGGWREPFVAAFGIEAARRCDHTAAAALLGPRLDPLAGRFLVLGPATITLGPVDRYRGLAALVTRDADAAVAALREAVEQTDRGGARVWALRSRVDLAVALSERQHDGDDLEAAALLAVVGQDPLLRQCPRLAREVGEALGR